MANSPNAMRYRMEIERDVANVFRLLNRMHISHLDTKQRKRILGKAARPVVKAAKANAPVDSGALRGSIKVLTKMKDINAVYVGPRYVGRGSKPSKQSAGNHAHFSEYGTRKWNSPHKGWFRRAVHASKGIAFKILKELVEAEFRKFRNRYGFTQRA